MVTSNSASSASMAARARASSFALSGPASAANSSSPWSRQRIGTGNGGSVMTARRAAACRNVRSRVDEKRRGRKALAQGGTARRQGEPGVRLLQRREQALVALDRAAATGADRPQRQPLAVVAAQARPQAGAQERRLASARRAEHHEEARGLARGEPAQRIDAAHDIGIAAEKDRRILRLQRLEPTIDGAPAEWAARVGGKLERLRPDAGLLQPAFQARQRRLGDVHRRGHAGVGMRDEEPLGWLAPQRHHLPLRGEAAGEAIERDRIDEQGEQLLAVFLGEPVFVVAPFGGEPLLRHEEEDDLATRRGILQRVLPALAGDDAALGVEIEEDVALAAPALADEPILERDRPIVVLAGMGDEKAGHSGPSGMTTLP